MAWGLQHISAKELTDWIAYEQEFGPLGQARDDQLTALLALVFANGMSALGGGSSDFKLNDFLPKWSVREPEIETEIERKHPNMAKLDEMLAAMGWTE